jgi:hypothetical protein
MRKINGIILVFALLLTSVLSSFGANPQTIAFDGENYEAYENIEEQNWYDGYSGDSEEWQSQLEELPAIIEEIENNWIPLTGEVESIESQDAAVIETRGVSTWDELRDAISDSYVSHITLLNSITRTGAAANHLPGISRELTIDGNGFTLNFGRNTVQSLRLARRTSGTNLTIQNLSVEAIGTDYFIMHNDTTAAATQVGNNTGNWMVHLHNVSHTENRTPAAMIKAQDSELILTGNIRWDTGNSRDSTAAASTAGMIVVRGLTITDSATVDLRALNTVVNINPSNRNLETYVMINGGSVVDIYSQNRQGIWMGRDRAVTVGNNPVSFTVTGDGTVLNARGDGQGGGQASGIIIVAGRNPGDGNGGAGTAISISDGAHVFVESVRRVGAGNRSVPAFIAQVHRSVFSITGEGTRVELVSNGGDNLNGATLFFRRVGNHTLHVNRGELIVTRRRGASTAAAIRFEGSNNTLHAMNAAYVRIHNEGSGTRTNRTNQGIQFVTSGNFYFWGGDLLTSTPTTVNITASTGPGVTNDGIGRPLAIMIRELATATIEGSTAGANNGAIDGRILAVVLDSVTDFDVVNRRPGGGRAFNVDDFSVMNTFNSTVSLWRSGTNVNDNATQVWERVDFRLFGTDLRRLEMSSYPRLTQGALGATGLRTFARFHATVRGPRLDNSELVRQINRITATQAMGGPIGNPYRNNFTVDSWNEMIRVRLVVDSLLVRHNPYLSRLALSVATNDIREATDNLVDLRPIRAELASGTSIVNQGRPAEISQIRWNEFHQLFTEAQRLVTNPAATNTELRELTARLEGARLRLVPLVAGDVLLIDGFNWVVLTVDENYNALVVTERIVGRSRGGATSTIHYLGSPLDVAMTNFHNRLSQETRDMILPATLPDETIRFNSTNRWPNYVAGGLSYVDYNGASRVFALSVAELNAYLGTRLTGAATANNGNIRVFALPHVGFGANPTAAQIWWLRSGGGRANYPMQVEANGVLTSIRARTTERGLRPAMWIGNPLAENLNHYMMDNLSVYSDIENEIEVIEDEINDSQDINENEQESN